MFNLFKVIIFCFIMIPTIVHASVLKCVGMDETGKPIFILLDSDTLTININGKIHAFDGMTKADKGITTENFKSDNGKEVYVSIIPDEKDNVILLLFDAATNTIIGKMNFSCHQI